jgi:hypothetical protein
LVSAIAVCQHTLDVEAADQLAHLHDCSTCQGHALFWQQENYIHLTCRKSLMHLHVMFCRAQQLYDSRQAEMQDMLAAMTSRQEELQGTAREKAQVQGVIDSCKANIQVRGVRHGLSKLQTLALGFCFVVECL